MFLAITVKHNPSNKIKKKLNLFYVYHGGSEYSVQSKFIVLKNINIFQFFKTLFETFMQFLMTISHVGPHILNHVCELCQKLDNFHFTNDFKVLNISM
jgi:hypothetical protein